MSFDITDDLSKARNKFGNQGIQALFNRYARLLNKKIDDELRKRFVMHEDLICITDLVESITDASSGGDGIDEDDRSMEGNDLRGYTTLLPDLSSNMKVYSINHTYFGAWSFPVTSVKFGAKSVLDGTQYQQLAPYESSTQLDIGTGACGIALWVKNLGAGIYGIFNKRDIASTVNAGIEAYFSGGNTVNCRISDGTNTVLLSKTLSGIDLTEDVWHSVFINIPASGNLEIFADKVSQGTISRGSVTNVNNSRDAYAFALDNAGTIQNKLVIDIAWPVWKKEIFDSTQRTDYHDNGILDLSTTGIEITTIPLVYDNKPQPIAGIGGFYA